MTDRARLDTLAPEELGRLVDRLRRSRRPGEASGSIPRVPRDQSAWPLAPAQERIWFLERLSPGAATYNIATCFQLVGDLSVPSLDQGCRALAERHEILRTRFIAINGEPCQAPVSGASLALSVVDLRCLGAGTFRKEAMDLASKIARKPFTLDHAPLARVVLLRLPGEDLLVFVLHHLLADEVSAARLLLELGELYSGPLESRAPQVPDLPIQYLDFSEWQRKRIADGEFKNQVAFWRAELAEAPVTNSLPYDRPTKDFSSADGGVVSHLFPSSLMAAVESFARRHQGTPFMVLVASIAGLLSRYSGDQDQALATPVANRGRRELEGVIGCFVNTLILRCRWAGTPDFKELLEQTRRTVTQATAHQDVPFEQLVRELAPERSLSRSPWAQMLVTLETQLGSLKLTDLQAERVDLAIGAAKMDLTLAVRPVAGEFQLFMEYRREVFDAATAERFGRRLLRVLNAVLEDWGRPVGTIDLLSPQERDTVLKEWGRGRALEAPTPLFPDLWEEVCQRHSQAEALTFGDESVTYGELKRRVEAVADHLEALGAVPEQLVGVMVPRSPSLVVAMLGVLQSGAAYLPLDPAYPSERIRFMLEDCGASILLTTEELAREGRPSVGQVVNLDRVLREDGSARLQGGGSRSPRGGRNRPEETSLAYSIYTSGSTGRPKGVAITHGSLARLVRWSSEEFSRHELSGFLAATSICFDLSVFEILVPLALGGRVVLVEDALALAQLPERAGVRLVNTVPSAIAELVRGEAIPPSVSTVNLAGEALSGELVRELYKGTRVRRVLNLYGPSEDTTYSTWAAISPTEEASPPIGRPLAESQAYVLDRRLQLAFPEIAGELFLGGEKLARGYWGRPGLTAERFLPDPFAGTIGGRLYRTGDRARFRSDGNLEFLGRLDHQIKHRGFRIELGEIETRLGAHPKVKEVATSVHGGGSGGRLVAFLVVEDGEAEVAGEDLKDFLRDRLPDFMVPGSFVWLPRLPRTSNGKINRSALPQDVARTVDLYPPVAPRSWREHQVCAHFQELLTVEPVGLHHDFFALGGHSLLAFRLALRLRESCGHEVSLRDIFERPTVAGLAQLLENLDRGGASRQTRQPRLLASAKGEGPLSFEQERLWFLEQLGEASGLYNLPLTLSLRGKLSLELLEQSWKELFQRQTALATEIFLEARKPRQRVHSSSAPEMCLVDLSSLLAHQSQRAANDLMKRSSSSPFPLSKGPLVRLLLVRLEPEDHLLVGAAHHIIADGRSLGIFMSELAEIYSARHEGREPNLPGLPVTFGDFARWQREWLQGEALDELLAPWLDRLQGPMAPLALPTDRPRPRIRDPRGDHLPLHLSKASWEKVRALAARQGGSPFMVLLGIFATLLARLSGQRDFAIGSPVSNRTQDSIQNLIGFFANTVVLPVSVSLDDAFPSFLTSLREASLFALSHQEVPLAKLVEALNPERDLAGTPLFQVMFALEERTPGVVMEGLETALQSTTTGTSKFDLTLFLTEGEGNIQGLLEYSTELFDGTTAERLGSYFERLLVSVLEDSSRTLGELEMLAPAEQVQLLRTWNRLPAETEKIAPLLPIHQLFVHQALRTPDSRAIVWRNETTTYGELERRSAQLGAWLKRQRLGEEALVAVSMERKPDLIATLLGALRAGSAYVPLDPAYPPERTRYILEDSKAQMVLSDRSPPESWDGCPWQDLSDLELPEPQAQELGASRSEDRQEELARLAYVIYTSGSTGRPKGVAITQGSAAEFVRWAEGVFSEEARESILASTSVCFDLSIFEIFLPLAVGGQIALVDDALALAGDAAPKSVTLVNTVPSAAAELLRLKALPASVRVLNLAGEALQQKLVDRLYQDTSVKRVYNLYGPSEDTTYSTYALMERGPSGEPIIGWPVDDTRVYVLDAASRLVPPEAQGELFLAGKGLARGYHRRPAETAGAFGPDPFAETPGERLYRTGDLVTRRRSDGALQYRGRRDNQVKIRGFRIEPGEIEAVLAQYPEVDRVAVTVAGSGASRSLVAHVVPSHGRLNDESLLSSLRATLERQLPAPMVPTAWRLIEALPLTPSGKIDRKSLAAGDRASGAGGERALEQPAKGLQPETPTQKKLAALWSSALGVEEVFQGSDFFQSGGHSLLATQVVAGIREELCSDFSLDAFFRTPTLKDQADLIDSSSVTSAEGDGPRPREGKPQLPLSFAQERIWFLQRLDPDSSALVIPAAFRLCGELSLKAFIEAVQEACSRHEALRTNIVVRQSTPCQEVRPSIPLPLTVVDLRGLEPQARWMAAQSDLEKEVRLPMDLAVAPLLRLRLLRLGQDESWLLISIHHCIADGWSLQVLMRDLSTLYQDRLAGRGSSLPPLSFHYGDYALWQREVAQKDPVEVSWSNSLAYWRKQLESAPRAVELPADRSRSAPASSRPVRRTMEISTDLEAKLKALCRSRGLTPFMVLLSCFKILLARLSGQRDVVVGTPVANRGRAGLTDQVGVYLNTLALRTDVVEGITFQDLLGSVRNTVMDGIAHQEVPFEAVLSTLPQRANQEQAPLFRVLFNMLSFTRAPMAVEGLALEEIPAPDPPAKFDLTVYIREEPRFRLDWVFDEHRFGDQRIETVVAQYGQLLESLVADPSASVESVPLGLPSDPLPDWTKPLDGGFEESLGHRFLETVGAYSERAAVTDAKGSLTYGELEEYSGRLASSLVDSGLNRGDLVAVFAHRSKELLVALLGVVRAGGRFVILDSDYPEGMLARRLRGIPMRAWVSTGPTLQPQGTLAALVAALPSSLRWQLPGPLPALASISPERATGPGELLYLAFTSGSSGDAKKIQAKQRPLGHFLDWQAKTFEFGTQDRFSFLSGLGHDPALRDLFAPLWCGGCLVIPDPARITEPGWLAEWLQREKISVAHLTPSLSQILDGTSRATQEPAASLRWAFFGGEALKMPHVQSLRRLAPRVRCVNFYGATETPQAMAWEEVGEPSVGEKIPVGRGIRNVQALVLATASGLPCGIGELGEIALRTPYLSEGYLGDDDETRFRFIANPAARDPGDRIYLTGDLGRFLPDGRVVVVGRRDDQLSIRGFRVEPGEVEAAILELSDRISGVAVVPRRSPDDAVSGLAAFMVLRSEEDLPEEAWRSRLLISLPTYLVPSHLERVESLPRTPNGKVDRHALEARAAGLTEKAGRTIVAPKSALEATLLGLWQEVLGQERLSTEDDFFALGGHSLLATRLVGRVQEVMGLDLGLRDFLDEPTVTGMARRLQHGDPEDRSPFPEAVSRPEEVSQPFPLTEIQEAYWVGRAGGMELGGVASHRYLELESGTLDLSRVERVWQRLIDQHPMLRAVILPDGRQQILSDLPPYRIEVSDLSAVAMSEAETTLGALRERMSHQLLDIENWPLFEVRAAKLTDGRSRLFISFDYLIADAWSFRLLLSDFLTLYEDEARSLDPIPLTFRDYVLAAQEVKESRQYHEAKEYWQRRISQVPSGPELPQSVSAANLQQQRFVRRNFRLPADRWALLKERAAALGFSPSCFLMTAFGEVLGAWSRTQRFSLVLTLFNRLPVHPEVARIVGDFTSTTLLVLERRPGESFVARAKRCQRQLWEDLDHRFFSGVEVVREMGRERGHQGRGATPIVFTSTLDVSSSEDPGASLHLPGEVVHSVSQTPQVLLDHQVSEDAGELYLNWDAVEAAFPPGLIDEMFSAYRGLIDRLVEEADSWRNPFVGALQDRVPEPAGGSLGVGESLTLLTGFLGQASENPDRVALASHRRQMSYGELEQESAALASKLQEMGVQRSELVAVVAEKGWEQTVATLGILRAGAAYLPLDPTWPEERMQRVLGKAGSKVAIWASSSISPSSLSLGLEVLDLLEEGAIVDVPSKVLPRVEPEDLAYVIFTSGSTGMPKGVTIDHRSAANTCMDINQRFGVGPEDCVLALSSLSFDLSVYDLFGAFSCGARVSLPEEEEVRDPAGWLRRIQEDKVTIWNSVPALLELFADFLELRDIELPSSLRLALLSGDWIPLNLPDRIRALCIEAPEIISLGGATEGSIWSILYPIGAVDPGWPSIPYGSAMTRQSVLVLDAEMEPTPTWVTGDLYLGGAGVALGYWGDPARTARSFLPHPETGERLYRTGDLGRLLGDGTIEFQGRQDAQVKVRGYRIELGEVEAALTGVPGARAVVAAAIGPDPAHRRLVAYFVGPAKEDELRAHATTRLPPYMVPEAFVPLESIPLTANGKVDRRALPDPALEAGCSKSRSYEAPRTPVEKALVEVVEAVLKVKRLGVHDSIFDLGASSVTAIQLISRIREHFQVEVPLRRLFDGPTVAQVAEAVLEAQTEQVDETEMRGLLAELEGLSDEEVQRLLELEGNEEKSA